MINLKTKIGVPSLKMVNNFSFKTLMEFKINLFYKKDSDLKLFATYKNKHKK